jgi:5S rRNA maturation endonuclease (ribonuclease M5)
MIIETIEQWVEEIKKSGKLIIVEGRKDRDALERLGIVNVITLNKRPLHEVVEDVSFMNRRVIILTDFDRMGKKLYGTLAQGLQHFGVEVDNRFREFLYKEHISHIEGLASYFERHKSKLPPWRL